jgi:hypothetical protein
MSSFGAIRVEFLMMANQFYFSSLCPSFSGRVSISSFPPSFRQLIFFAHVVSKTITIDLMYLLTSMKWENVHLLDKSGLGLTYTKYRYNPPVSGSQSGKKLALLSTPNDIVKLERIQLHSMVKDAVANSQICYMQ